MPSEDKPAPIRKRIRKRSDLEKAKLAKSLSDFPIDVDGPRVRELIQTLEASLSGKMHRYAAAAGAVIAECLRVNVADPAGDPFFEYDSPAGPHSYHLTTRMLAVGETLWKLRHSLGFSEFCARLRDRDRRSAFIEVLAARTMFDAGFEIRAKPETGKKGQDFDFSAVKGTSVFNVEATALEPEAYNQNTVRHALENKRQQLPTNNPAIVFCSCPEKWFLENTNIRSLLQADAEALFQRSERVNAVVFMTETRFRIAPDQQEEAEAILVFPFYPFAHTKPRCPADTAFLFDTSTDQSRKYGFMSHPREAIEAQRRDNPFHRWVDDLLGPT